MLSGQRVGQLQCQVGFGHSDRDRPVCRCVHAGLTSSMTYTLKLPLLNKETASSILRKGGSGIELEFFPG